MFQKVVKKPHVLYWDDTWLCAGGAQAQHMNLYNTISAVHEFNSQQTFHFLKILKTEITHVSQQ